MEKSLWDIAVEQRFRAEQLQKEGKEDPQDQPIESCIFVCGSKQCGKSSMIMRFLERDENSKPTVALDYTFARRPKGHKMLKDICHIYELGGGASMSRLIESIVSPSSTHFRHLSVVLVLDLSKPNELWHTQEVLIKEIRRRVEISLSEINRTSPSIARTLREKCWERIGDNHTDKSMMDLLMIPFLIIGSNFDKYQEFEPEKKKVICRTLRFLAHKNGATIQFTSNKIDNLSSKTRSLLANLAFGITTGKATVVDHNKPIIIHAGHDKFEDIGAPPISSERMMRLKGGTPYDLWREAFAEIFPPENAEKFKVSGDPSRDRQYAEPSIDEIKAQKDQELANYRKSSERKAKEASLTSSRQSSGTKQKKKR
eukprot:Seg3953.2 transcript_id=Seg3953.2/GoldUCD/mRNA.D3Y31 product="Cytoplasmic dynein 2 light intermediate chain 1" protein_id=Seg3953.2/GoldUCD/D3Y31